MHLRVRKNKGEKIRKRLIGEDALDERMEVERDNRYLYFPLKKRVQYPDTRIVERAGVEKDARPKSLKESLSGTLSSGDLEYVPSSFDVIGDIAILEIPAKLEGKKEIVAKSLLKTFRNINVVAAKETRVSSEYRIRHVEVIAGERRTKTLHREHGCIYRLDVESAYFSPRLSAERLRVAKKVKKDERVLVMFAGVGPYAVLIAKKINPKEVIAVELNPDAVRYMGINVSLNRVNVEVIEGDVRVETPKLGRFNRIIMPLPKDAGDFLDVALPALKKDGVVHFYDFSHSREESIKKVRSLTEKLGYGIKVLDAVKCGSYNPSLNRICVDFKIDDHLE
ncbi:MAG: tRNA (guanine-N1)-methyltransferase [Candidatus Altiarchaeales archaeon ex4484_2]|nr:MAG: tRNA (guanine-N1)-methyltransferase [Candidatus Altiarchaeales archaeon ex4484_2]